MAEQRTWAKQVKARNLQKLCKEKFPLTVGSSQVCKWRKSARKEAWKEIPALLRSRITATTNSWRLRLGLKAKGRRRGGRIPLDLQRELDFLVFEHAQGMSSVSERKEVVTIEHVVTCC